MDQQAKGSFEVTRSMEPAVDLGDGVQAAHVRFDKVFSGPFTATSVVHMLAAMTAVEDSGAYVAIERVHGTLDGRSGTFLLQHRGVMDRGAKELLVTVVPDSGTDGLVGLRGRMAIDIVEGQHFYTFDYSLPDA